MLRQAQQERHTVRPRQASGTLVALLILTLAGCAGAKGPLKAAAQSAAPDWHELATDDDQQRLRSWRDAWTKAADAARQAGAGAKLDADPALFDPDRALDHAAPPPGVYRCRWIKLGSAAPAVAPFTAYPAVPCRIAAAGKLMRFRLLGGAQRPHGYIFPDGPARDVFLGTLELGDETRALEYGRDTKRDMAGYLERIGENRWRLALPQPHFESLFDIIEITPAA
ncbi:MAG TPA: DUF4893 domain-containing protein [Sphingomonas sp.]|nr:DUF4893 domain-containing protein [Sphingomonas sp.]